MDIPAGATHQKARLGRYYKLQEKELYRFCDRRKEWLQVSIGALKNITPLNKDGQADNVNNPKHYTSHPSGIECIQITEHMGFNLGNALKYVWRCDEKHDAIEDLHKAKWYIEREIAKRENTND